VQCCPCCGEGYCSECRTLKRCDQCEDCFCDDDSCGIIVRDRLCCGSGLICDECVRNVFLHIVAMAAMMTGMTVRYCMRCDATFCFDCLYLECSKDWENSCSGCIHKALPMLEEGL